MSHQHRFVIEKESNEPSNKCVSCLKSNTLTIATVAGVVLGITLGLILRATKDSWSEREIMYVGYLGDLFLRMLKCLIIPLVISSLASAIASLDLSLSSKIATRAIAYYITAPFVAVVLGIVLVLIIKPGSYHSRENHAGHQLLKRNVTTTDTLLDLVKNMFSPNIVEATIFQYRTRLTAPNENETDLFKFKISTEVVQSSNVLSLVVAAAVIGIAISQLRKEATTIGNFFHNLMAVSMKITSWVIFLSPGGVFFLVASKVLEMDDIPKVMSSLGLYFSTVCLGLLIHGLIILPLIYFTLTRKNPYSFIRNISPAIATGFGTASSTATLPLTIKCLEEKIGIDSRVARFALPIGTTIDRDGTALYEAVAAIFIAQVRGVPLDFGHLVAICVTATAASIGVAGIPQAGLVTMVMVLDTVGLPAGDVTLVLAVDWLLDRFRTALNIIGDSFGAGIVYYRSLRELGLLEETKSQESSLKEANMSESNSVEIKNRSSLQ